jgi:undecaprenyl-diphosphatase
VARVSGHRPLAGERSRPGASGHNGLTAIVNHLDWTIVHALNGSLAGRDWLEDPITFGASALVPMFAAATVGLWLLARPYGVPTWKRACLSALLSAGLALALNQTIAHYVWERPRPFAAHPGTVHLFAGGALDPSFPSDHAAAAFAIAIAVLFYARRAGIAFGVVAVAIAVSRVVEGLHYPSDVLAGAMVGALAAVVVTQLARPLVARLATMLGSLTDPLVYRGVQARQRLRSRR